MLGTMGKSTGSKGEGTHVAGNIPGGLGTLDGNSILSQVIVLHLRFIPAFGVQFLGRRQNTTENGTVLETQQATPKEDIVEEDKHFNGFYRDLTTTRGPLLPG